MNTSAAIADRLLLRVKRLSVHLVYLVGEVHLVYLVSPVDLARAIS